ncbi:MAG: hypothetical protein R6X11_09290 [Desulfonatronovibrio sp.]
MPAMTGQLYDLDDNYEEGLKQAVNNNQPALAFQYLLRKLEDQENRLQELERTQKPTTTTATKKTASKKTTKKTAETTEE